MDDPICRAIGRLGKRLGDGNLKNDRINQHGIGDGKGGNEYEADPGHESQPPEASGNNSRHESADNNEPHSEHALRNHVNRICDDAGESKQHEKNHQG